MNIEYINTEELQGYEKNTRTHSDEQVDQLVNSINEFGFTNPLLIDGERQIIAGHGRLAAAKKIPMEKIPCIVLDHLTDDQRRAYVIADNKLALNAGWDEDLLKLELGALDLLGFDLSLIGFDPDELSDLVIDENIITGLTDEDDVPDLVDDPLTKLGDIWVLGDHRLMCGDSTKEEDVGQLMNEQSADMVFTDPPWNVNYGAVDDSNPQGYKPRTILNDFMGTEEFKNFMDSVFKQMAAHSKTGCPTYVVMSAQEWGNMMLTLSINDYHWSSTIIWNKSSLVLSRKDYHTKYEPIWYGWLSGEARLCPLKDRKQSDVWDIDRPSRSELHPTTKPVELVERAIRNSSRANNYVLDLFGGSGSTLIACEKSARKNMSMELDPKYCDVIIKRWQGFTGKQAVHVNGGVFDG
jgi:DNA modification methylase